MDRSRLPLVVKNGIGSRLPQPTKRKAPVSADMSQPAKKPCRPVTSSTVNKKGGTATVNNVRPNTTRPGIVTANMTKPAPNKPMTKPAPNRPTTGPARVGAVSSRQQPQTTTRNFRKSQSQPPASMRSVSSRPTGTTAVKKVAGRPGVRSPVKVNFEEKNKELKIKIEELEKSVSKSQADQEEARNNHETQMASANSRICSLETQSEGLQRELTTAEQQIAGLNATVAALTATTAGLEAQLKATQMSLERAQEMGRQKDQKIMDLQSTIAERDTTIVQLNCKIQEQESMRRQLHNTIQELKGNIRVFCRVRPLVGDEQTYSTIDHINFPDEDHKVIELEKLIGDANLNESTFNGKKGKFEFSFDRVFNPDSTQQQVFSEISQLVQSALDGYNVCIFAYGQTGSGKTFTMEGSLHDVETLGMIPRAVEQIFKSAEQLQDKEWKYNFEAWFLEIYNETIRDLLGCGSTKEDKHEIRLVAPNSNEVTVTNLTVETVKSAQQVNNLLKKACQNRAVAETKCNERSSRSHSVFRLKLTGENSLTGETSVGLLNLIDLAGSERLKESGSQGARLKETQAINKSLANLGNVIMALANKENHIPFRNSKLTHLLQNCLGGSSKTLMFVNVSPKEDNFGETLNSLRFATKVNNCNIGTAQKKVK